MSLLKTDLRIKNELESTAGVYNGSPEYHQAFERTFFLQLAALRLPSQRPFVPVPRFFITNPPIPGQPIDFALLTDEQYRQINCYQKESRLAEEMGGQVLV